MTDIIWYVIVRKDNGYPLQVCVDKKLVEEVAKANNEKVVTVQVVKNDDN